MAGTHPLVHVARAGQPARYLTVVIPVNVSYVGVWELIDGAEYLRKLRVPPMEPEEVPAVDFPPRPEDIRPARCPHCGVSMRYGLYCPGGGHASVWRQELAGSVAVSVDTNGYPELAEGPAGRPVRRVLVTMPDFVADDLAHSMAALSYAARVRAYLVGTDGVADSTGELEQSLALALSDAAAAAGYRCPQPGLLGGWTGQAGDG